MCLRASFSRYDFVLLLEDVIHFLSLSFDYKLTMLIPLQYELALAADEGVRQLLEQTDGEVSAAEKASAMKVATSKRAEALHKKMSKLVCVANPDLTYGWLGEVCPQL
jgi:hypothetical protein